MSEIRNTNRNEVRNMLISIYVNIFDKPIGSDVLELWVNMLVTKQSSLYDFLVSIIAPGINSLNIVTVIRGLYLGVLKRLPTMNENSRLVSIFNDELREYGARERALKKMIQTFVKNLSVKRYCSRLKIDNI